MKACGMHADQSVRTVDLRLVTWPSRKSSGGP